MPAFLFQLYVKKTPNKQKGVGFVTNMEMGKGKRAHHPICNHVTGAFRLFPTHTHTYSEKIFGVYYPINKRVEQERHTEGWAQPGPEHELPETKLRQPKANSCLDPVTW